MNAFATFCLLFQDNDSDEEEDFHIKPDDNLIVTGHVDEDFSALEISGVAQVGYINLYRHHTLSVVLKRYLQNTQPVIPMTVSTENTQKLFIHSPRLVGYPI